MFVRRMLVVVKLRVGLELLVLFLRIVLSRLGTMIIVPTDAVSMRNISNSVVVAVFGSGKAL